MKKAFEEAYGNVKAPDSLKAETLILMEAENEKQIPQGQKASKRRRSVWGCGLAGAVLCAALICLLFLPGRDAVYITPMEDGVHWDMVELEDGVLRFLSERMIISVTPNAGNGTGDREGTDPVNDGEADCPVEKITAQSGGTLTLYRQDAQALLNIPEEDWSHINGQQVYVTVLKTETIRYQATFEKDGMTWEITGVGVTQKEFIDYLYKKINE